MRRLPPPLIAPPAWAAAALLLCLAGGCAARIPAPSDADAVSAQARWPGTTREDLAHGRRIYLEHCGGCHRVYLPGTRPSAAWPALVEKMAPRSKLDPPAVTAIVHYLMIAAEPSH